VRIVGADPAGSILSGDTPGSWKVEGIGEDFFPDTFDPTLVDAWVRVTDGESFAAARRLAREEGILAGGSAGTALHAAILTGRQVAPGSVVVVLLPDTGRNYLSKLHSDAWMEREGFASVERPVVTCGQVVAAKRSMPPLVSIPASTRASDVARMMSAYGISHVPVTDNGLVLGTVDDVSLIRLLHDGVDLATRRASDVMYDSLPVLDENAIIDEAYRLLSGGFEGMIVMRDSHAIGLLSRSDLVDFWSERSVPAGATA